MSLTDLPTNDGGTMSANEPGPRKDRPRRRTFSAAYKLHILTAYEQATAPGERGALLRKEGLYHSHIKDWKAGWCHTVVATPQVIGVAHARTTDAHPR